MKPLFLFSLPRAGSTLAQRILASHSEIATVSEPWLLLPFLYALKERGIYAEYGHFMLPEAIKDFCSKLPNGQEDYLSELRELVMRLYGKAARQEVAYFLDKTPRYHLIVDEIIQLFPDGKFIFLWRHPLAVLASIIETWAKGSWNLYCYKVDIFKGLENLISAYLKYQDCAYAIQYENLIENQEEELPKLLSYLDLPADQSDLILSNPAELKGRWSNPANSKKYESISNQPLEKWKQTLANPIRKAWCRDYLKWIGEERLAVMGYSLNQILVELDSIPLTFHKIDSDIVRMTYGITHCALEPYLMKQKLQNLNDWKWIYTHA